MVGFLKIPFFEFLRRSGGPLIRSARMGFGGLWAPTGRTSHLGEPPLVGPGTLPGSQRGPGGSPGVPGRVFREENRVPGAQKWSRTGSFRGQMAADR